MVAFYDDVQRFAAPRLAQFQPNALGFVQALDAFPLGVGPA